MRIVIALSNSAGVLDSRTLDVPDQDSDDTAPIARAVVQLVEACALLHVGDTITIREVA